MSDIMPFELCRNLYFVGSTKVSVHIIKTECGLVMIDTGYPDMYEQILDSMKKLELDPKDICAIFHSHGHVDHFGCTVKFKELSEAKTYISREDNSIANGSLDLSWAKELGVEPAELFDADVLIEDGDVFSFGDITIRCILTPGHTDGTLTFIITLPQGNEKIVAAMHGGIGANSMTSEFLNKYNLSFDCREKFRKGLHTLASEHVDLVLGNHPQQNDTEAKLSALLSGVETVTDSTEWQRLLKIAEERLDDVIKKENE